jgi:hypothetical protein
VKRYLTRALLGLLLTLTLLGHIAGKFSIPFMDEMENLLYDTRWSAPGGKDSAL